MPTANRQDAFTIIGIYDVVRVTALFDTEFTVFWEDKVTFLSLAPREALSEILCCFRYEAGNVQSL